jgi:hypothetical protein
MTTIAANDPVTCAIYAKDNNLLDVPNWKRFKSIARRQQHVFRMANQAKLRSFRLELKYKYGFEIMGDYKHAVELDEKHGTSQWVDATSLEMVQLDDYDCFHDQGKGVNIPKGFKKIRVHLICDVKHDGRHKALLVADGHLSDIPVDSVYSGVVTLQGLRLLIFLAELNDLQTWAIDIGNAYLEALTLEKVCSLAGPEFGNLQGHVMIIYHLQCPFEFTKHSMAFAAKALAGTTVFQTACMLKVSFHARLSQTFGCGQRTESMSILLFMSMIWQLLWLIRRNLWIYWKRFTSCLSSRDLGQLLFTLAVTSSVMTKASCAWLQRNTLKR